MKMKRIATITGVLLALMLLLSADKTPQEKYIDRYAPIAVSEMYRSGVPASITLAQGILESRSGLSELASKGNNHFGIKCHDWKGKSMKVDDDKKGECFRVYDDVADSYSDHSDFLRYSDRYRFLFDYQITDYKAWAHGLKKAGYATDPQYAYKLIKNVEDYNLSRFDNMTLAQAETQIEQAEEEYEITQSAKHSRPVKKRKLKTTGRTAVNSMGLPLSPSTLEQDERLSVKALEEIHFSIKRPVYTRNGVPFVYAEEGESYTSIAESNGMLSTEILRDNDLKYPKQLLPGDVVYLRPKKNYSKDGLDKYIVAKDGEDLWTICQRFAVKQKTIMKLNGFASGHQLREGDTILLKK